MRTIIKLTLTARLALTVPVCVVAYAVSVTPDQANTVLDFAAAAHKAFRNARWC